MDITYPRGHSINDGIPSELASVSYASVDDAVQLILQLGKGSELVKLDLKQAWKTKNSCTRKDLESLLGHLSHVASVVKPGHTFLRKLFTLLHGMRATYHFARLSAGARADLAWWWCFLQSWNGSSFFPPATVGHCVHSDASGTFGCGAFLDRSKYFMFQWPQQWCGVDISAKEMVSIVMAATL